ncbi:hypothetical protein CEXT_455591 [Caerostris extrusa]|uniref:Uncharacterized protein n=1 Tax=Caerostris extrusa TaxID=172846 RepID=A0AAV4Y2C2_CAEEX|nr:hypothetical protein CEXT_455591 [Caerostris extrusa]
MASRGTVVAIDLSVRISLGLEVNEVSCSRRCLKRLSCKFESMEGGETVPVEGLREVLGNMEQPLHEVNEIKLKQISKKVDESLPVSLLSNLNPVSGHQAYRKGYPAFKKWRKNGLCEATVE